MKYLIKCAKLKQASAQTSKSNVCGEKRFLVLMLRRREWESSVWVVQGSTKAKIIQPSAKSGFMIIYSEYLKTLNGLFPSWTDATCLFKSLIWKNCSHRPQIWIAYFLLEQMQRVFQVTLSKIFMFTNFTFEWLISIMNWWNMFF